LVDVHTLFPLLFLLVAFCSIRQTIRDGVSVSKSFIGVSGLDNNKYALDVKIFVFLEQFLVN